MMTLEVKFGLSEKHTKFEKNLPHIKTMRKIFSNFVCFSKSPNFTSRVIIAYTAIYGTEI